LNLAFLVIGVVWPLQYKLGGTDISLEGYKRCDVRGFDSGEHSVWGRLGFDAV